MKLYTCQMSSWRKAKAKDIPFLDVTVKSGDKRLAPTWDFLMQYKKDLDEDAYTESFFRCMRNSFSENREFWLELLRGEELCIACYCASCKFCHRKILVDIFRDTCKYFNIPFKYMGEL